MKSEKDIVALLADIQARLSALLGQGVAVPDDIEETTKKLTSSVASLESKVASQVCQATAGPDSDAMPEAAPKNRKPGDAAPVGRPGEKPDASQEELAGKKEKQGKCAVTGNENKAKLLNLFNDPAWSRQEENAAEKGRIYEQADEYCRKIIFAIANGDEKQANVYENMLLQMTANSAHWRARAQNARETGKKYRQRDEELASHLKAGVASNGLADFYKRIPNDIPWKNKVARRIAQKAQSEIDSIARKSGAGAARQALVEFERIHGKIFANVTVRAMNCQKPKVDIVSNTCHTLNLLPVAKNWDVYIDETGTKFSMDDDGKQGSMVAVCVPSGSALPKIGDAHGMEGQMDQTLKHLNVLLQNQCGILGLSQRSLALKGELGWRRTVVELVKWVWRLLPLPEDGSEVSVNFFVEEHPNESASEDMIGGQKILAAELASENPERARQLQLLSFSYVAKFRPDRPADKANPMIAWADVVAYLWNSNSGRKYLREARLAGTCLVDLPPAALEACESICSGGLPSGKQWLELISVRDCLNPVNLAGHALASLQKRCQADGKNWENYVMAMQEYLLSKSYTPDILEKMATWLRPMQTSDPRINFYWHLANLARLNHRGAVDSQELRETMAEVERLSPELRKINDTHYVHAQLRLAVADSNAFDFSRAESRLARWNPLAGGHLTDSALWNGKILSSLGQYRAFQRDNLGAIRLFEQALDCFAGLASVDPAEAGRQSAQTRTYLAIASMDSEQVDNNTVSQRVAGALGQKDIISAINHMQDAEAVTDRYGQHLLVRYLAKRGSGEEKAAYLAGAANWCVKESGVQQGHPWPQIQYYRWLLADDEDTALKAGLGGSLQYAMGRLGEPTVDIIVCAVGISMGQVDVSDEAQRGYLLRLKAMVPHAERTIDMMMAAHTGDATLAMNVLPFNYC